MDDDRFIQGLQDLKKRKEKGNQDLKLLQVIVSFLQLGDELPLIKVLGSEMKM